MAIAQETFQHLQTAGLAEIDPAIAELLGRELERQRGQIELIASENFTWPAIFEARRLGADEQVRRGLPGPPLLRRLRGRRRDRADRDRPRQGAVRRRARERPAARGRADEHGRLHGGAAAGRHDPLARALARRPPHARAQGQLLRPALHDRPLRRLARDEPGRLRRRARAGQAAQAEADRVRRLGLPAHGRDRPLPRDRRRGRRAAALRHGALRRASSPPGCTRTRSRTATSSPRPRTRRSPARAPGSSSAPRSTRRRSTAPSSRGCRAGRSCTRSRPRRPASGSPRPSLPRVPDRRCARTPTRSPTTLQEGGLDVLTGGTDTHLLQVDLRSTEWTRQGRRGAARRGEADRQPQHGAVRRAAADGRVRDPDRHARGDDARLRRGRLPRGRRDHLRRARRRRRRRRARARAARRSARSGRSTRASAATPRTSRDRDAPAASPSSRTRWSSTSSRTCATRTRRPSTSASSPTR